MKHFYLAIFGVSLFASAYSLEHSYKAYGYGVRNTIEQKYSPIVAKALIEQAQIDGSYSNDAIHEWACDVTYKYSVKHPDKVDPKFGCYDTCYALSFKVETTGVAISPDGSKYNWQGDKIIPQGLGDEYWDGGEGYEIANACAIVLNGAEW